MVCKCNIDMFFFINFPENKDEIYEDTTQIIPGKNAQISSPINVLNDVLIE